MQLRTLVPAGALGALLTALPGCRRDEAPVDEAVAAGLTRADLTGAGGGRARR